MAEEILELTFRLQSLDSKSEARTRVATCISESLVDNANNSFIPIIRMETFGINPYLLIFN